jgi:ATP-binding cassette subfamily F protein uup
VCTATWEVHDRIVEPFEGGYAAYVLQRVERDRQAAATRQRRQNLARKELAWLRRGRPGAHVEAEVPHRRGERADRRRARRCATPCRCNRWRSPGWDVTWWTCWTPASPTAITRCCADVEWRIAPGRAHRHPRRERVRQVDAAGLMVSGTLEPTTGRVKRGKTVKVATLTQRLDSLEEFADEPVRVVHRAAAHHLHVSARVRRPQELTPSQLLERLGFSSAQLSTPVKDLSGGQKRRLQLLLILLDQPNVLILDEPTNDLDTDMLAAMEDLLDSWPGTLLVVSHDRYFLERVTDQQYAILGGRLRHLPGGVEEYLTLRTAIETSAASSGSPRPAAQPSAALSGAEQRAAEKELASLERRVEKLHRQAADARMKLADLDQTDYQLLGAEMAKITALDEEASALEERWLELSVLAD